MRKRLIIPLTLLLVLMQAIPVWAGVNLNINGKLYEPANPPQLEQGTTMVPLDLIGRVLGADISSSDQVITIKKGSNTLIMTVGSTKATFNGVSVNLPGKPKIINGNTMVPMRFIYEKFGATVNWQGENQTITVNYAEKRQGMSVEEMLAKSSEAMAKFNAYKMKIGMNMQTKAVESANPGKVQNMDMSSQMIMATQQKPVLMYGKTSVKVAAPAGTAEETGLVESEMLMNENGMYMTLPGQGWVKFNIPGMDMKSLLAQSGNQDPLNSLQQMKDFGVVMSYADDQEKNGKSYWIINVTMGAESLNKVLGDVMKKLPVTANDADSKDASAAMGNMMNELFKNMQADIVYNVWIDQSNYQLAFMDLEADMKLKIQPPESDKSSTSGSITMDMKEKASYEIYDLGIPFTVPDVSQAIDMQEYMEKQMQATKQ